MEKPDQKKNEPHSQTFPCLLQPVLSMSDRFPLRMEEIGMFHFTVSIRHPGFPVTGKNRIRHEDKKKIYTATDTLLIDTYNKFASNETYKEKIKPIVDKALGGTLRLFVQKVYEGSYFTRNEETVLSVSASLPNGTTLPQMNTLMSRMEAYLSTFKEIRQFQTNVYSARQAGIRIYFTKESERSGFPYTLKAKSSAKLLIGGGELASLRFAGPGIQ